jgi:predicted SAM-dependent methyltransferase
MGQLMGWKSMDDKLKINLGSGHWKFEGWVNVDLDHASEPDVVANLATGLPFANGVARLMHTEDFIDQLELDQAADFLRECHRILSPGGVLRVLTPDMQKLAHLYLNDPARLEELWKKFVRVPLSLDTPGEIFNVGMRFAGHTFLYDAETFQALATRCGFEARRVDYQKSEQSELRGLDLRSPEEAVSMYFDCYRLD